MPVVCDKWVSPTKIVCWFTRKKLKIWKMKVFCVVENMFLFYFTLLALLWLYLWTPWWVPIRWLGAVGLGVEEISLWKIWILYQGGFSLLSNFSQVALKALKVLPWAALKCDFVIYDQYCLKEFRILSVSIFKKCNQKKVKDSKTMSNSTYSIVPFRPLVT